MGPKTNYGDAIQFGNLSATMVAAKSIHARPQLFGQRRCEYLRELLISSEPRLAESLVAPVIDRFTETLAKVASDHAGLPEKRESLKSTVGQFLDATSSEFTVASSDWDSQY